MCKRQLTSLLVDHEIQGGWRYSDPVDAALPWAGVRFILLTRVPNCVKIGAHVTIAVCYPHTDITISAI